MILYRILKFSFNIMNRVMDYT